MEWDLVRSFFIALLAITNPLGTIPLWIAGSEGEDRQVEWRLALLVTTTAAAILLVFLLGGRWFLGVFGIDLAAFRIGGGIVILLVALDMIRGNAIRIDRDAERHEDDKMRAARSRFEQVAVPLAMPMMAGPGSISTVVVYASRVDAVGGYAGLAAALGTVMAVMFLVLLSGRRIERWVGRTTLDIQTRVFGLILAGIAVQFVVEGLGEIFPAWLTEASTILDELREEP
jgi:multiple antibiotic resistance protein